MEVNCLLQFMHVKRDLNKKKNIVPLNSLSKFVTENNLRVKPIFWHTFDLLTKKQQQKSKSCNKIQNKTYNQSRELKGASSRVVEVEWAKFTLVFFLRNKAVFFKKCHI